MSFLLPLVTSIATNAAASPIIKTIEEAVSEIGLAVLLKQASFRVGNYSIVAKINGQPASMTASAGLLALEMVLEGKTGTFVSGVVEIDVVNNSAAPVVTSGSPNTATLTPQ